MFEGSEEGTHGGLIENVEARHCQGCFSGYPIVDLVKRINFCAESICISDEPFRGGKTSVNLWAAGNNVVHGVYAENI